MAHRLYTIGYEGSDIETFLWFLQKHSVDCLLDVRQSPISRKKFFSKHSLSEKLLAEGIEYVHLPDLGSPKELRNKLKTDRDYASFFAAMEEYLCDRKDTLEIANQHVSHKTCCLMCFEHQAQQCHRTVVAKMIKEKDGNGLKIDNL